jgi:hypothetical protein
LKAGNEFFFNVQKYEKMAALRTFRPPLGALIHSEVEGINDLSKIQEQLTQYNFFFFFR